MNYRVPSLGDLYYFEVLEQIVEFSHCFTIIPQTKDAPIFYGVQFTIAEDLWYKMDLDQFKQFLADGLIVRLEE